MYVGFSAALDASAAAPNRACHKLAKLAARMFTQADFGGTPPVVKVRLSSMCFALSTCLCFCLLVSVLSNATATSRGPSDSPLKEARHLMAILVVWESAPRMPAMDMVCAGLKHSWHAFEKPVNSLSDSARAFRLTLKQGNVSDDDSPATTFFI
jgi:hypothetical protein